MRGGLTFEAGVEVSLGWPMRQEEIMNDVEFSFSPFGSGFLSRMLRARCLTRPSGELGDDRNDHALQATCTTGDHSAFPQVQKTACSWMH